MMSENHSSAGTGSSEGTRYPRVTIAFERPRAPRYPRLAHARHVGETVLRYLGLALAGLWVFGGALFFLIRFSYRFYVANEGAIADLVQKSFG